MPKGKRGPRPEMTVTSESDIKIVEESFLPEDDPTAEEIVGEENVVNVDDPPTDELEPPGGMRCADCTFTTNLLSELEEHAAGTGHGRSPVTEPEQQHLPNLIRRDIEIGIDPTVLNDKRKKLADLYQQTLDVESEKKAAVAVFNGRLAAIDEQMQEIARVLQKPFTYQRVDCEWRIIEEENARGLYRLDTGEQIDKQPLTEEDRAAELAKVETDNAQPEEVPA